MAQNARELLIARKKRKERETILQRRVGGSLPYDFSGRLVVSVWNGLDPTDSGAFHTIHSGERSDFPALIHKCFEASPYSGTPGHVLFTPSGTPLSKFRDLMSYAAQWKHATDAFRLKLEESAQRRKQSLEKRWSSPTPFSKPSDEKERQRMLDQLPALPLVCVRIGAAFDSKRLPRGLHLAVSLLAEQGSGTSLAEQSPAAVSSTQESTHNHAATPKQPPRPRSPPRVTAPHVSPFPFRPSSAGVVSQHVSSGRPLLRPSSSSRPASANVFRGNPEASRSAVHDPRVSPRRFDVLRFNDTHDELFPGALAMETTFAFDNSSLAAEGSGFSPKRESDPQPQQQQALGRGGRLSVSALDHPFALPLPLPPQAAHPVTPLGRSVQTSPEGTGHSSPLVQMEASRGSNAASGRRRLSESAEQTPVVSARSPHGKGRPSPQVSPTERPLPFRSLPNSNQDRNPSILSFSDRLRSGSSTNGSASADGRQSPSTPSYEGFSPGGMSNRSQRLSLSGRSRAKRMSSGTYGEIKEVVRSLDRKSSAVDFTPQERALLQDNARKPRRTTLRSSWATTPSDSDTTTPKALLATQMQKDFMLEKDSDGSGRMTPQGSLAPKPQGIPNGKVAKLTLPLGVIFNKLGERVQLDGGAPELDEVICTPSGDLWKIEWIDSTGLVAHCRRVIRSIDPEIHSLVLASRSFLFEGLMNSVESPAAISFIVDECRDMALLGMKRTSSFPYLLWAKIKRDPESLKPVAISIESCSGVHRRGKWKGKGNAADQESRASTLPSVQLLCCPGCQIPFLGSNASEVDADPFF
jgi:hypothetical protein